MFAINFKNFGSSYSNLVPIQIMQKFTFYLNVLSRQICCIPATMAQTISSIAMFNVLFKSMGVPKDLFKSLITASISLCMCISMLDFPMPRSRKWRKANLRCSFHLDPLEATIPENMFLIILITCTVHYYDFEKIDLP